MSYCRFENTLADLRDCLEHINDSPEELGVYEVTSRDQLVEVCRDIIAEFKDDSSN